ncbi:MAG TPA: hypothetical protein VI485_16100 [Vicinamibacterales bacterium]|nr:hypothetical protein [Vicinamibacterales bacterium]
MKRPILTLRISRRAIGAAVLEGDALTLVDGRHLTSRRDRAAAAAVRYIERLLDLAKPHGVALDLPRLPTGDSDRIASAITTALQNRKLNALVIGKADVLTAYSVRPLRTRAQLREIAHRFWPDLQRVPGQVQPYVADAAVAALYAESRLALHPPPT